MHLILDLKAELDLHSADKCFSQQKKRQGRERGGHAQSFNFVSLLLTTLRAAQS